MDVGLYCVISASASAVAYVTAARFKANVYIIFGFYTVWACVLVTSTAAAAMELRRFNRAIDGLADAVDAFGTQAVVCASHTIDSYISHVDVQVATVSIGPELYLVRNIMMVTGVVFPCAAVLLFAVTGYTETVRPLDAGFIFSSLFAVTATVVLAYCDGADYIKHVVAETTSPLFLDARQGCNSRWSSETDFDRSIEACTSNLDSIKCTLTESIQTVKDLDTSRHAVYYFIYGTLLITLAIATIVGPTPKYTRVR